MIKYSIRFNKSRGQPGRGTVDHVWRVFENDKKEYLFKNLEFNIPVKSEKDINGVDYNITCTGYLDIDRNTSTARFLDTKPKAERKKRQSSTT